MSSPVESYPDRAAGPSHRPVEEVATARNEHLGVKPLLLRRRSSVKPLRLLSRFSYAKYGKNPTANTTTVPASHTPVNSRYFLALVRSPRWFATEWRIRHQNAAPTVIVATTMAGQGIIGTSSYWDMCKLSMTLSSTLTGPKTGCSARLAPIWPRMHRARESYPDRAVRLGLESRKRPRAAPSENQSGPLENSLHHPMMVKARTPTTRAKGIQIESTVGTPTALTG